MSVILVWSEWLRCGPWRAQESVVWIIGSHFGRVALPSLIGLSDVVSRDEDGIAWNGKLKCWRAFIDCIELKDAITRFLA